MPIIKSAIKRVRVASRKRKTNLITANRYKALVKEFKALVDSGKQAEATKLYPQVQKAIDFAAKKNLIHKNRASRQKSSLAKMLGTGEKKATPAAKKEEKA